jgi:hypothetical protein
MNSLCQERNLLCHWPVYLEKVYTKQNPSQHMRGTEIYKENVKLCKLLEKMLPEQIDINEVIVNQRNRTD